MIVTKHRINAQNELLESLKKEMVSLKDDLTKVQIGWDVEGITDPSNIEELITLKRREINAAEDKLAEMETVYHGAEVERPKPREKKRLEPELFSFC